MWIFKKILKFFILDFKTPLFKETTCNCHILAISPFELSPSVSFPGGRSRETVPRDFHQTTGNIPVGHTPLIHSHFHWRERTNTPFPILQDIRISDERISKEYPVSLFPAKPKGISHSTLFAMIFGRRGVKKKKKVRLPPTHSCQYATDAERRYVMQLRTRSC